MGNEMELLLIALAAMIGIVLGANLEASRWREKAVSGFRMASGGNLYVVKQDEDEL